MGTGALFELCNPGTEGKFEISLHSAGYSFLALIFWQIDARNLSNLFLSVFEILPLFCSKDQAKVRQGSRVGKSYPNHHYNELSSSYLHIGFLPSLRLRIKSRKCTHTI